MTPEEQIRQVADLKAERDKLKAQVEDHEKNWQALASVLQPPPASSPSAG